MLAGTLLGLWSLPTLAAYFMLPYAPPDSQLWIDARVLFPSFPIGIRAQQLHLRHGSAEIEATDVHLYWTPAGLRATAKLGGGSLRGRSEPAMASGFVQLSGVALEALPIDQLTPLALRGSADGVVHYNGQISGQFWVQDGTLSSAALAGFGLGFRMLLVQATQESDGGWRIEAIQMQGPPLTLNASGRVREDGELAVDLELQRVEEPVRGFLRMLNVPVDPLPMALRLEGPIGAPKIRRR